MPRKKTTPTEAVYKFMVTWIEGKKYCKSKSEAVALAANLLKRWPRVNIATVESKAGEIAA